MSKITFSSEQKAAMVDKLQNYFETELDTDLGQFDAEFLLDFFSSELGAYYYNRGLEDARKVVMERITLIDDDLYGIEKEIS